MQKVKRNAAKILSLVLALACVLSVMVTPVFAQGGSTFEYGATVVIANNTNGGIEDGVTYLTNGAEITLLFTLPANSNVCSGEVNIEYDPKRYSAAIDATIVSVTGMTDGDIVTNSSREYETLTDPAVIDNMSSTSNSICQFFWATANGFGNMSGGVLCEVTFTCIAETSGLTPATALDGSIKIVSTMANYYNGSLTGTDISKNGLDYTINNTISKYMLSELESKYKVNPDGTWDCTETGDDNTYVKYDDEYIPVTDDNEDGIWEDEDGNLYVPNPEDGSSEKYTPNGDGTYSKDGENSIYIPVDGEMVEVEKQDDGSYKGVEDDQIYIPVDDEFIPVDDNGDGTYSDENGTVYEPDGDGGFNIVDGEYVKNPDNTYSKKNDDSGQKYIKDGDEFIPVTPIDNGYFLDDETGNVYVPDGKGDFDKYVYNEEDGTYTGQDGKIYVMDENGYMVLKTESMQLMFDYDYNGIVNSADLGGFKKLLTGTVAPNTETLKISDINGDKIINATDLMAIRKCLTQGTRIYVDMSK